MLNLTFLALLVTVEPWHVRVTGYCPCPVCCGRHADGLTASGAVAKGKLVAAPKRFRFGTSILVPGYHSEPVPVLDRGGAIKGNRLDLLFPTHQEAVEWGSRKMTVYVVRDRPVGLTRLPAVISISR